MKYKIIICIFLSQITLLFANPALTGPRVSSAPFISGDGFRCGSDHILDETTNDLDPLRVKKGDVIFVKTDFIHRFFYQYHPQIQNPYILVTHNSDYTVPRDYAQFLDDPKLLCWYGQNVERCSHPKLHPIPIGVANQYWSHGDVSVLKRAARRSSHKEVLLYLNFDISTYPSHRQMVYDLFKNKSYCHVASNRPYYDYLLDMRKSCFVLSPRGNGPDCHRTWEALYMGAIPIVISSELDPLYEGLPVVIVKDYREVTEEFMKEQLVRIRNQDFSKRSIDMLYWIHKIKTIKRSR